MRVRSLPIRPSSFEWALITSRQQKENIMTRVLSTEQAKSAISQMQSIIDGGFTDQITQLDAQGQILSDPDVWDGPLAMQFRDSTWPNSRTALQQARSQLEELRQQLSQISDNIFSAGGAR